MTDASLQPTKSPPMPVGDLLVAWAGVPDDLRDSPVTGLAYDSRRVRPGFVYFGLAGAKTHGAAFAAQAKAAGAVALVTDDAGAALAAGSGLPVVVVGNPRIVMAHAAARFFGDPTAGRLTFGVTGTMGKSTTCYMIDAALRAHGLHTGSVGTIGFAFDGVVIPSERTTQTTPESVDLQAALAAMAERGAQAFDMEASSSGLLMDRVEGVRFDVVGFTNLGRDHMDVHPTVEDYFLAKAKLFRPGWAQHAVVNIDDPHGRRLSDMIVEAGSPGLTTIGDDPAADYRVVSSRWEDGRQRVKFVHRGQDTEFSLALPGRFNVTNAIMAAAMMAAAGFDERQTLDAIGQVTVPGRMEPVDLGPGAPTVIVDFGHTPEATEAALQSVPRPVMAVLGSSGERDAGKRPLMGAAAARWADAVIVTDDNARSEDPQAIRDAVRAGADEQARKGDHPVTVIDGGGRGDAIRLALTMVEPNWTIIIFGCGDREYLEVGGRRLPFKDANVVKTTWAALREEAA